MVIFLMRMLNARMKNHNSLKYKSMFVSKKYLWINQLTTRKIFALLNALQEVRVLTCEILYQNALILRKIKTQRRNKTISIKKKVIETRRQSNSDCVAEDQVIKKITRKKYQNHYTSAFLLSTKRHMTWHVRRLRAYLTK